ncbi:GNAT family N-acetyltransferase [Propylenella binzhouense]|uniref:GNAT family N-acetyltransferase n=1 Tax=Propylenella binzhouense TaxID=2555902 RepID=A0A964T5C4_9HYPH|nr:GNAT family N-acetyltransferase [Propylenella binzhouense]MYZ48806.1 GNAT family N-acetyltransferase [Propylenella binzhouense]
MSCEADWRPMRAGDLDAVMAIAARVHPAFPEARAVFEERLRLAPAGCWIAEGDDALGYLVSHPWLSGTPPKLDTCLGAIPSDPDCWYVHDLALLPCARGSGLGRAIMERLKRIATEAGLPALELVSVSGSGPFWQRLGFEVAPADPAALASYGSDARLMRLSLRDPGVAG